MAEFIRTKHGPSTDVYLWVKRMLNRLGLWVDNVESWEYDHGSPIELYSGEWYVYQIQYDLIITPMPYPD